MNHTSVKAPARGSVALFRRLLHFIRGRFAPTIDLEQRLFIYTMFLSMLTGFSALVIDVAIHLDILVISATLVAAVFFAVLWLLARHGVSYTILVYPVALFLIIVLSTEWFLNDGSRGGVPMYLLICPFITLVFSRGIGRIITVCVFITTSVFLLAVEFVNPSLFMKYSSDNQRLIDVSITFFLCMIIACAFILVIHNGYRRAMEKSNEEKRESEARFFETSDMLPVMICETAQDLSISFVNKAGATLTGYAPGEFGPRRTVLDLLHPEDRARAKNDLERILSGGRLGLQEYRLVQKDGTPLWILMQCDHVYKESAVTALRMCMIDVTEKKMLEEQYRQAQKMESIGFLAGGMAHDFNNILSVIMGYAFLIRKDSNGVNRKLNEQAAAILKAGDRAADLVKKLLAFSRQGNFEVKPLNMHDLINEVEALLSHSLDKRITIAKNLNAPLPVVAGDQVLLQSALLNLAINARDAMPAGGTLTFSTAIAAIEAGHTVKSGFPVAKGSYLAVAVEDTGVGMDENAKAHLFEPFFSTKAPGKGTGLGLASVFGTVRRHNGFIESHSIKSSGTTMTIYLPLCKEDVWPAGASGMAGKPSGLFHVLVIDDEEMICSFVKEFLDGEGYRATVFTDAARAMEWYLGNYGAVDCAIIDMNMPGMDGRQCFTAMRKINPKARAIFATGFALGDTATLVRMDGINGFIQKPFALDVLIETISRVMKDAS